MHKVGDNILINVVSVVLDKIDAPCTHAYSVILYCEIALDKGADSVELGIIKPEDKGNVYVQRVK
jgi:hypothetical protein